jgi:glycosyltransferase involved in cell wall biosynthesis
MACGKAMIVALEGEGAKVVGEAGAGWVVPPENPEALANAVLAASQTSKARLSEMGAFGERYFSEQFERSVILSRLEAYLADAAGATV